MLVNIYSLKDPLTNEIRYVGKTEKPLNERLRSHINKNDNTHVRNWIKKLKRKNLKPIIEIVDKVPISEWQFWEIFYISLFKSWGFNLTNHTIGGDGYRILHHTEETKKKISQKRKEQGSPWMKNRFVSKEVREKTSNTLKGRTLPKSRTINIGKGHMKKIKQFSENGKLIKTYDGIITAAKIIEIHPNTIQMCVSGKCRSAGGFIWRYEEDNFDKYPTKICEKLMKTVLQFDLNGVFIKEWESTRSIQKELGYLTTSIINCCNGKQKTAYKFKWEYKK